MTIRALIIEPNPPAAYQFFTPADYTKWRLLRPHPSGFRKGPRLRGVLKFSIVKRILTIALASSALWAAAYAQTFDAVSIKVNPPRTGFHFATDSGSGGPGTPDSGIFRCAECTLATLVAKAFDLRSYQFPGKSSLGDNTFEVMARIPAGATQDEFQTMLRNMLKDRFSLEFHFNEKKLAGYRLTIAKSGSKLVESSNQAKPPAAEKSQENQHSHTGLVAFGPTARFRADRQTMADLARLLSDQLRLPVEDETGLKGLYDISLSWSGNNDHSDAHADGNFGGNGHGDHGGLPPAGSGGSLPGPGEPGPALLDAVQSQLGLKLVSSEQTTAKIFMIDRVEKLPTAN